MRKFVSISVLVGMLLTGCDSSTENESSDKVDDSESYTIPSEFGPSITGLFNRYTGVTAPNGKTIHIFSQSGVSVAQLLKARNTLKFFLTDDTVVMKKSFIANSIADRRAALFIFDDEDAEENAMENSDFADDTIGNNSQSIYATEIFVEGDSNYLADSPSGRDATFEEVLHLIQAQGISPAMRDFQVRIANEAETAIEDKVWNPREDQIEEWAEEGDDIIGYTTSHEYFAAIVEAYYGMWEHKDTGMDGYIANSRDSQALKDKTGLAIVNYFLPEYIPTMMDIDASFSAGSTFHLSHDESLSYTTKSQYLTSVRLTGTNNSNITGNAQDNILMGNQGDNKIDGKGGVNTYKVNGLKSEFLVSPNGDDEILIQDTINTRNGTDTLTNIQKIKFNDSELDLSKL